MINQFYPGQLVKCVDNKRMSFLNINQIYKIVKVEPKGQVHSDDIGLYIEGEREIAAYCFYSKRFVPAMPDIFSDD